MNLINLLTAIINIDLKQIFTLCFGQLLIRWWFYRNPFTLFSFNLFNYVFLRHTTNTRWMCGSWDIYVPSLLTITWCKQFISGRFSCCRFEQENCLQEHVVRETLSAINRCHKEIIICSVECFYSRNIVNLPKIIALVSK